MYLPKIRGYDEARLKAQIRETASYVLTACFQVMEEPRMLQRLKISSYLNCQDDFSIYQLKTLYVLPTLLANTLLFLREATLKEQSNAS